MADIKSVQILYDKDELEKLRPIAIANEIKPTVKNLVDLAIEISINCVERLDAEDFKTINCMERN